MKTMLMTVMLVLSLTACGGKSEAEKERETESGRGTVTCSGSAMSGEAGLPADFPEIEGVTYVESEMNGPTQVVDGFAEQGLEDLYDAFNSGFEDAGYTVLFNEREEDDAEVSYRTKDGSTEGQVALRSCDEDKTSVHITARPE